MKRFVLLITSFFLFFMTGQVFAQNNLNNAASKIETGISNILKGIGNTISLVAKETGKIGLNNEEELRKLLRKNVNDGKPYVIDSTFIDSKGIMKNIEPDKYRSYEGSDISKQEAVIEMIKAKKPRMGNLFLSVENIKSVDIEYPVFLKGKQFIGSVSILIKPDEMIRSIAAPIEKDLDMKFMVMQKEGGILYETDATQIGRNTFTDPLYKDYPELIALSKKMIKNKEGQGFYNFHDQKTKNIIKKQAVWKTIHFFNNDWIVVAYREAKNNLQYNKEKLQ
jgi:hypothetical protein